MVKFKIEQPEYRGQAVTQTCILSTSSEHSFVVLCIVHFHLQRTEHTE